MIFELLLTFFLVFLNGFFVAAEFAIVKVRGSQIEVSARSGNLMAKLAHRIVQDLDRYLAATQLGITLASLALGWVGEEVVAEIILAGMQAMAFEVSSQVAHAIALPVAFLFITVLHIVFGELIPKSLAINNALKVSLFISFPLRLFYVIFKPFIFLLNGFANRILKLVGINTMHDESHSADELKYLMRRGSDIGTIENTSYTIIENAFEFTKKSVRQILIPRTDVVALDINNVSEDVLDRLIEEGYSRIPCYEGNLDAVVGVIYLRDILAKIRRSELVEISTILRPTLFIPESMKLGPLLKKLQKKHIHLAMVLDEFGGVSGIVTMEDILEELIGDIQDESDEESSVVEIEEGSFKVIATASIHDINKLLPRPVTEDKRYETLAGLIIAHVGNMPNVNEKIYFDQYECTILKRIGNRIVSVRLRDIAS